MKLKKMILGLSAVVCGVGLLSVSTNDLVTRTQQNGIVLDGDKMSIDYSTVTVDDLQIDDQKRYSNEASFLDSLSSGVYCIKQTLSNSDLTDVKFEIVKEAVFNVKGTNAWENYFASESNFYKFGSQEKWESFCEYDTSSFEENEFLDIVFVDHGDMDIHFDVGSIHVNTLYAELNKQSSCDLKYDLTYHNIFAHLDDGTIPNFDALELLEKYNTSNNIANVVFDFDIKKYFDALCDITINKQIIPNDNQISPLKIINNLINEEADFYFKNFASTYSILDFVTGGVDGWGWGDTVYPNFSEYFSDETKKLISAQCIGDLVDCTYFLLDHVQTIGEGSSSDLTTQIEELNQQVKTLTTDKNNMQAIIDALTNDKNSLQNELDSSMSEKRNLLTQINAKELEITQNNQKIIELTNRQNDLNSQITNYNVTIEALKNQGEQYQSQVIYLENQRNELNKELTEVKKNIEDEEYQNILLNNQVTELNGVVIKLESKITQLTSDLDYQINRVAELQSLLDQHDNVLNAYKKKVQELNTKIQEIINQIEPPTKKWYQYIIDFFTVTIPTFFSVTIPNFFKGLWQKFLAWKIWHPSQWFK